MLWKLQAWEQRGHIVSLNQTGTFIGMADV
jgi:hypothetical protein